MIIPTIPCLWKPLEAELLRNQLVTSLPFEEYTHFAAAAAAAVAGARTSTCIWGAGSRDAAAAFMFTPRVVVPAIVRVIRLV